MSAAPHAGRGRRDALAVLVAQVGMLAASLAVQALLAWQLMPAGRGEYAVLAVIGTLLPTLCAVGLDRAVQYQLMSGKIALAVALGSSGLLVLVAAAGAIVLLVAAGVAGVPTTPPDDPGWWLAAVLLIVGSLAHTVALRLHIAVRAYRRYLYANLLQSLVSVGALLVVLAVFEGGFVLAAMALALSYLCAAALSVRWLVRDADGSLGLLAPERRREAFGFGARFYPTLVGHAVDFNAGTLVLAAMATASEVGIYAALSALMLKFLIVAQALQEALLPRVAADSIGIPAMVAQMARLAVVATFVAVAVFLAAGEWIVALLLSPAFVAGVAVAWWLAPGIVAHAASTVLMPHFEGRGMPGVVSLATWVGLVANVLGLLVLYPRMGIAGAGLAMTVGLLVRLLVLLFRFRHSSGTSFGEVLVPRRGDAALAWSVVQSLRRKARVA
jgi:O-antigen/teichoic acid export membrane protein